MCVRYWGGLGLEVVQGLSDREAGGRGRGEDITVLSSTHDGRVQSSPVPS